MDEIRSMKNRNDIVHYEVMMGFISSGLLAIIELVSFLTIDPESVSNINFYLYSAILMAMQFMIFLTVYVNDFQTDSKFLRALMLIHPYLIITIGVGISYIYQGFSNQIYSYLVAVFAASLIQIYPVKRRMILFAFSLLTFTAMAFFTHGISRVFYEQSRINAMMLLLCYMYTMIQFMTDAKRMELFAMLEANSIHQNTTIQNLTTAYEDLDQSRRITEAMMNITAEILKNDQFDEVLQMILDEAIKVIPKAQAGSILIYNGEVMEYRAASGYRLSKLQKIKLRVEDLFQATFKDMYEPEIIQDLKVFDEAHMNEKVVSKLHEEEALIAKSVLTCSFKHEGQFLGLINLDNFESTTIFNDIDKRMVKHLAKQLEITIAIHKLYGKAIKQTRYDVLTQANSRRYHQELLQKAYENAKLNHTTLSICSLDLNNLKELNDRYGHDAGDDGLRYFASIILKTENDHNFFSRLGGDEFVLVYPNLGIKEVSERIQHLREFFNDNPFVHSHEKIFMRFGCGIATFPYDGLELEDLVKLSDKRMYEDKERIKYHELHHKS